MTCSESGMTAGATIFAGGASATHGAVVSMSKKTAPCNRTACKTSERVSALTANPLWTFEQAFRTIGQARRAIRISDQERWKRSHSWPRRSRHKSMRYVGSGFQKARSGYSYKD